MAATFGTPVEFEDGIVKGLYLECCELDTDKYVIAYSDDTDGDAGKAVVCTVSGTTITVGAISEFCSDIGIGRAVGLCKLDSSRFIVVYADNSDDDGYARVGSVSGTTISWGNAVEFHDTDVEEISCCLIDTDKVAIVYDNETGGDLGTVCILTISGTTITAGTPVAFEGYIKFTSCCKLDTDKFIALYEDSTDSGKMKACAFTVSGTTPTAGTVKEIDGSANCQYSSCAQLDTDKAVLVWGDATNSDASIQICTVAADKTISVGTEVDLNPTSNTARMFGVAKINTKSFAVTYEDQVNSSKGIYRTCTFSGTTITLGDEEIFRNAIVADTAVCLIATNKIAIAYKDDVGVSNNGMTVAGTIPGGGRGWWSK